MQRAVRSAANVSAAARYIAEYLIPSVNVHYPMFDEFAVVVWLRCLGSTEGAASAAAACAFAGAPKQLSLDVSLGQRSRGMVLSRAQGRGPPPPAGGGSGGEQPASVRLGSVDLDAFQRLVHGLLIM